MLTYLLIGAAALVVALTVWNIRAGVINRRLARELVPHVREMRALASKRIDSRPPRPDEPLAEDTRPLFEAAERDLLAANLTVLGDLVEVHPDGRPAGHTRWFIDDTRTVCGWFGVVRSRDSGHINPVMMVFSETDAGEFFETGRGSSTIGVAEPPTHHSTTSGWSVGLRTMLASHRAALVSAGVAARVQPATLEAGPALVARMRDSTARWRAVQRPDELLQLDLKGMLGQYYETLGPLVLRAMKL